MKLIKIACLIILLSCTVKETKLTSELQDQELIHKVTIEAEANISNHIESIKSQEIQEECFNECKYNNKQCYGKEIQRCGNFDEDGCLEWSSESTCQSNTNCYKGSCVSKEERSCVRAPIGPADLCTQFRCMVKGITDGRCYSSENDCDLGCFKGDECLEDSDCETENNKVNVCERADPINKCIAYEVPKCTLLKGNENSSNIRFVFVPQGFSTINNELIDGINKHISTILATEPFSKYSARLNFYLLEINYTISNIFSTQPLQKIVKNSCDSEEIIIIDKNTADDMASPHKAVTTINDPWITLHELGHSFGGLGDTYIGLILFDGNSKILNTEWGNIDQAGCPKWCKSHKETYQTECTKIRIESQCRQHERIFRSEHWECKDPLTCCVWLDQKDPFFKSQCVNFRDDKDIGIDCIENSGCFYGAGGSQMVWRPTDTFGIMTDDLMQSKEYESVSKKVIEKVILQKLSR